MVIVGHPYLSLAVGGIVLGLAGFGLFVVADMLLDVAVETWGRMRRALHG